MPASSPSNGYGIGNAAYAVILTAGSLVGMLTSVLLGWLSDRIADRRLLVIGCAAMAVLRQALVWCGTRTVGHVATHAGSCRLAVRSTQQKALAFDAYSYLAGRGSGPFGWRCSSP